ncbi:bombyxin B-3-like [Achroia grisella]|uniref:bombyxin B-3-like n=1 Tax=Achroia grisella TaxID=688607 RepID=UPI0027D23EA6|nr:bombyxin B-3-like [Achroia grisella]
MKLAILSCLAALLFNVAADEEKVNLCGPELARARVLLCFGAEYVLKRSSSHSYEPKEYEDQKPEEPTWLWSGRHGVHAARWAKNKRGLVDDCCLNPCTTDVILSYC